MAGRSLMPKIATNGSAKLAFAGFLAIWLGYNAWIGVQIVEIGKDVSVLKMQVARLVNESRGYELE
jgi:hypothetical protein